MRFSFPYSHAFPNGRVVEDDGKSETESLVEFADGTTIIATWRRQKETIVLGIPDYRTAKGTRVNVRHWRLVEGPNGIWRTKRTS